VKEKEKVGVRFWENCFFFFEREYIKKKKTFSEHDNHEGRDEGLI